MKKVLLVLVTVVLLTSCGKSLTNVGGEVTGVRTVAFNEPAPYGMVLIKRGSFEMGPADKDSLWGINPETKGVSFDAFWMDDVFFKTDMQSFQADITARLVYNKMFNGGFSWRVNESVILLLGAKFGSFHVGYAYDFPTTPILKGTSGSHELMVSYKLKLKKSKSGKNKHKSVRIL